LTWLIAAAGTGGHVFPALAVGEALLDLGVDPDDIQFVGGNRLEAKIFPDAGFPFHSLELAGFKRSWSLSNLGLPRTVWKARNAIANLIERRQVQAVLGLGGYVTVPAALAARHRSVPLLLAEQNAEAGLANRLCSRWARRVFTSFPQTAGLRNSVWVGNPIRRSLATFDRQALRAEARGNFGIEGEVLVVGVMGGSLGASVLNRVAFLLASAEPDYLILHLAGNSHQGEQRDLARRFGDRWIVRGFETRMELFYAAIDVIVARAGGVVAEYTATGTPAVLIPGGFGSGDHQAANARALTAAGAAVTLTEADIELVRTAVDQVLARREDMAEAATRLARPNAAHDVAQALLTVTAH
jgi:UDP-N-acetylglucosamine--N-acetylmuramyl-(pentapeptide) pyrophosphoryl-undecaprenol N-acetylglucosamine transferase